MFPLVSHLSTCGGRLPLDLGSPAPGRSPRYKRPPPRRSPAALPSSSPPSTLGGPAAGPQDQTGLALPWSGAYCEEWRGGRVSQKERHQDKLQSFNVDTSCCESYLGGKITQIPLPQKGKRLTETGSVKNMELCQCFHVGKGCLFFGWSKEK